MSSFRASGHFGALQFGPNVLSMDASSGRHAEKTLGPQDSGFLGIEPESKHEPSEDYDVDEEPLKGGPQQRTFSQSSQALRV